MYVIDLETTGLLKEKGDKVEIIQYAIYKIDPENNWELIRNKFCCPKFESTKNAIETHGYSKDDLAEYD